MRNKFFRITDCVINRPQISKKSHEHWSELTQTSKISVILTWYPYQGENKGGLTTGLLEDLSSCMQGTLNPKRCGLFWLSRMRGGGTLCPTAFDPL